MSDEIRGKRKHRHLDNLNHPEYSDSSTRSRKRHRADSSSSHYPDVCTPEFFKKKFPFISMIFIEKRVDYTPFVEDNVKTEFEDFTSWRYAGMSFGSEVLEKLWLASEMPEFSHVRKAIEAKILSEGHMKLAMKHNFAPKKCRKGPQTPPGSPPPSPDADPPSLDELTRRVLKVTMMSLNGHISKRRMPPLKFQIYP